MAHLTVGVYWFCGLFRIGYLAVLRFLGDLSVGSCAQYRSYSHSQGDRPFYGRRVSSMHKEARRSFSDVRPDGCCGQLPCGG